MRTVILLAVGIFSYLLVFLPGYFFLVPRPADSIMEQSMPEQQATQEIESPEFSEAEPPMETP